MRTTRRLALPAIAWILAGCQALAQTTTPPVATSTDPTSPVTSEAEEEAWSLYASAYTYIVPDSEDFLQPSFMADRGELHLEARYNYEDLQTSSLWLGCNFSVGEKLVLESTAMLGVVMGDTTGLAPGYRFTLGYWKLELASEGEYLFDSHDSAESFFYNWSELSISPVDWFRAGLVVQRTKLYQTNFDIQRGLLVGFAYKNASFTGYVFNPDESRPTVVLALGLQF